MPSNKKRKLSTKFLPGEPVLIDLDEGKVGYAFIRSHAQYIPKYQITAFKVEMNRPLSLKGKLWAIPIKNIHKIKACTKTNWAAVRVTCGWAPDFLQGQIGGES